MRKILAVLLISISAISCSHQKEIDAIRKHQSETGDRLNRSQHDTDSLFKEMD